MAATCVERSGGQGYLSCNRMCQVVAFSHSGITAEGDNCVLMQKVAKEVCDMVVKGRYALPEPSKVSYINEKNINSLEALKDIAVIR